MPTTFDKLLAHLNRGGKFATFCKFIKNGKNKEAVISTWYPVEAPPETPTGDNLYFSVFPVGSIPSVNAKGKPAEPKYIRTRMELVSAVNCLFADFDAHLDKSPGNGNFESKEDAWECVQNLPKRPSVIIDSGRGFHCYWLLRDTQDVSTKGKKVYISKLLKEWVAYVDGDTNAADLAHVMRIPGSTNPKMDPAHISSIIESDFSLLYSLTDLASPQKSKAAIEILTEEKIKEAVEEPGSWQLLVVDMLPLLSPERYEYNAWLNVGMAIHTFENPEHEPDRGLNAWIEWSRKGPKFDEQVCRDKWLTFDKEKDEQITYASLKYWANEDTPGVIIRAPKNALPVHYADGLLKKKYKFSLNECDNSVVVNGAQINDIVAFEIMYDMKNAGYRSERDMEIAWTRTASKNRFHPIKQYLNSLKWDGKDYLSKLNTYFPDKYGLFPIYIKRWLIAAVRKVLDTPMGHQSRMLVLEGAQDIGKSYFVRWLATGVLPYYIEAEIDVSDKDAHLRKMSKWIWEVGELVSTFNRSENSALKFFLTNETVTVRRSFGHFDIVKPSMANFIGTLNNESSSFLMDTTGNRRYMVVSLKSIDKQYSIDIDPHQLWAQVVDMWKNGEPADLTDAEAVEANIANTRYETENIFSLHILKYFDINKDNRQWVTPTAIIVEVLKNAGVINSTSMSISLQVASALKKFECYKEMARFPEYGNKQLNAWYGINIKPECKQLLSSLSSLGIWEPIAVMTEKEKVK